MKKKNGQIKFDSEKLNKESIIYDLWVKKLCNNEISPSIF